MILTPDMDLSATDDHGHCQCIPRWAKVIVPLIAAAFISFVVISQLQQIHQLTHLHSLKETEIREIDRIRAMRDREFVELKASMGVRNVLFREIATHVGVPAARLDAILADDPMAPPPQRTTRP